MAQDNNPFTENIVLEYFVGREEQLKQFRADLKGLRGKNPNHQYIAGMHGTGKTYYLAKLAEIARAEGFLAVMTKLTAQSGSRGQVMEIFEAIVAELEKHMENNASGKAVPIGRDWEAGENSKYFKQPRTEELKIDRVRQDFLTLWSFIEKIKIPGCVVCIDEGQRIDGFALSTLKNALQDLNSYLIVLSLRVEYDTEGMIAAGRKKLDLKANDAEGDIGASRFLVTGVPIGPFENDQEVYECINRRLQGNVVQFDDEVIFRIALITKRTPRDIIRLANNVYYDALNRAEPVVNIQRLNDTFRNMYRKEVLDAQTYIANISSAARSVLCCLLDVRQPSNAAAITTRLYPAATPEMLDYLANGIQGELDRLCGSLPYCLRADDRYDIPNSVHAYALGLALGKV
jgi:hypothetical protein